MLAGDTTVAETVRDEANNDSTSGLSQWLHSESTAPANNRRKPPQAIQKLHRKMKKPSVASESSMYNDESTEGTEMADYTDTSTRTESSNCGLLCLHLH